MAACFFFAVCSRGFASEDEDPFVITSFDSLTPNYASCLCGVESVPTVDR
jgi:hypothetical protein